MKKRTIGLVLFLFILFAGVGSAFVIFGLHYQDHFFENAYINGIDVSDLTVAEAEKLIAQQAEDYHITVVTRDGGRENIYGEDFGYHFVSGGEVQGFLDHQNILLWPLAFLGEQTGYTMKASVAWDEELLRQAMLRLSCMQEDLVSAPEDAYVRRESDGTFVVVPEVLGNKIDEEKAFVQLKQTVEQGGRSIDLGVSDCYQLPKRFAMDGELQAEAAIMNQYCTLSVTYQLGGGVTEVLDAKKTSSWFSLTEDHQPCFDKDAVAAWVNDLADRYDTIGAFLPFVTTNGETVYPESRTYGWQMDREAETEALYQMLMKGESGERTPIWQEGAWTRGFNDLGNTYVEIDYTNQRMWYYKDGALLVDTAIVTGNVSAGNNSPEGIFCLVGKEENAILVGEDYKTPVSYWMPFYGGVGIHDADTWRTTYGGDIYQWGGSHGCINTPTAKAAIIFQNITVGTPIVCYRSSNYYGYGQESVAQVDIWKPENSNIPQDIWEPDDSNVSQDIWNPEDSKIPQDSWTPQPSVTEQQPGYAEFPITIQDEWSGNSEEGYIIY